ncbi:hypothetical protein RsS62_47960 [Rhizobium dioscoreae]|uniref:Uncharacterized protein n=1 Tax=Rhizobium dioscoreae TaxID=2653122 RepID=A0ABQ0Z866_9HYPH|nr:hypothetical protein RsS62_47960 [Rhizobium dioscoreae]GES51746.1 hypothetical protein RsS93_43600 [Rhizobium dioscoreae]GLU83420.1 hypothetical protein Rhsp01_45960 [Rhizobium sp. NBRC 114257]
MRARILNHFAQLVDDRLWGRKIWIAHAEVDNVRPARSRARFQTIDLFENVGRQTPDFMKLFHFFPHGTAALKTALKFVDLPASRDTNLGLAAPYSCYLER